MLLVPGGKAAIQLLKDIDIAKCLWSKLCHGSRKKIWGYYIPFKKERQITTFRNGSEQMSEFSDFWVLIYFASWEKSAQSFMTWRFLLPEYINLCIIQIALWTLIPLICHTFQRGAHLLDVAYTSASDKASTAKISVGISWISSRALYIKSTRHWYTDLVFKAQPGHEDDSNKTCGVSV